MNKRCLLVDTCNLMHRIPHLSHRLHEGIDQMAEDLLSYLRPLHDLDHWELHLVIDGKGAKLEQQFIDKLKTVSLIYSPSHMTADTIIESWLIRLNKGWQVRVASEDRAIFHSALSNNAEPISASDLIKWVESVENSFRRRLPKGDSGAQSSFGNVLDDLL